MIPDRDRQPLEEILRNLWHKLRAAERAYITASLTDRPPEHIRANLYVAASEMRAFLLDNGYVERTLVGLDAALYVCAVHPLYLEGFERGGYAMSRCKFVARPDTPIWAVVPWQ